MQNSTKKMKKSEIQLFNREIWKTIHQKFAEKCKIRRRNFKKMKKSEIQFFNREKNVDDFWLKF